MNNWLRKNKVDILKYLPEFLSKDPRFAAVNIADNTEHERLKAAVADIINQLFVNTATWGLDLWEEFCGLQTDLGDAYVQRRARVLDFLNANQVSTLEFITYLVNRYVADKTGIVVDHPENYSLDIFLPDNKITSFEDLEKALRIFVPAHIAWRYLVYVNVSGNIYVGGVVTGYIKMNVEADTDYAIEFDSPAEPINVGVVTNGYIMNIPSELYV